MATEKESRIQAHTLKDFLMYDESAGILTWRVREKDSGGFNRKFGGKEAFTATERKGYKTGRLYGVNLKAHRVAWALHFGEWPENQIDHINGNKSDNRVENLRPIVNHENCRHKGMHSRNTSGYTGVSYSNALKMWAAKYKKDYTTIHVGYFNCVTSAALAVHSARVSNGFSENHGYRWQHE